MVPLENTRVPERVVPGCARETPSWRFEEINAFALFIFAGSHFYDSFDLTKNDFLVNGIPYRRRTDTKYVL